MIGLLAAALMLSRLVIDLSEQRLYAYDDADRLVYSAAVSTGLPQSPTPVGTFTIGVKYADTPITGADYHIPSVRHVMCLSGGGLRPDAVCLHPAPWQERAGLCFGVPRSHGCIRTSTATAAWLFPRTAVGVPVIIRP
jgi:lipoprotein-anchoring transpeptidase ErfK/SrfK